MAVAAWIAGGELDPTMSISLPGNPVDEGELGEGASVIAPLLLLVPLASALLGGVLGDRFHRAIDRARPGEPESALEPEPEEEPEPEGEPETETETAVEARTGPNSEAAAEAEDGRRDRVASG